MALDASDEHRQGRTLKNGACCLADDIAGAFYVRLETRADITQVPAVRRPMNQRRTIRIGVIDDTHGLFDPAIRRHFVTTQVFRLKTEGPSARHNVAKAQSKQLVPTLCL